MSNTPTPLRHKFPHVSQSVGDLESEAGSAASVLERGRLRGFGLGARTRPAPGFFSDVTQFDLTDFAGQKRDLRTMEPVAGEIGHCFVVGARHQLRAWRAGYRSLHVGVEFVTGHVGFFPTCPTAGSASGLRASMSAGWRGSAGQVRRNFGQLSPHRTTGNCFSRLSAWTTTSTFFFAGKNSPWRGLGRASMPGRWRGRGLLEQGAQVGHGGVALALAREFEVYDMVVHSGGAIDLRI